MMRKILFIIIALLVVDIALCIIQFETVKRFINSQNCLSENNAAVIFFSDYNDELNEIGKRQKKRLDYAISQYKLNKFYNFILVGGNRIDGSVKGSELSKKYLVKKGIKPDIIHYDSASYDTKTNWIEAQKIIQANNFERIICISSPLHIYRISKIVDDETKCYSTYGFELNNPLDYIDLWLDINKELFVFTLYYIIPEKYYIKLIKYYRDQKFREKSN